VTEFVHPDDLKAVMQGFEDCLGMPNKEIQAEFRFKLLDGSWLNLDVIGKNHLDNPSIQGLVVNIRDVTKRKLAEEALRVSEVKFKSIVEHALEGILILDLQGAILLANNAAVRTIEADDCAGLIGRNVMEFIAPESREDVVRDFIQVSQGHDAYLAQYNVISAKGNKFCVESIGKVISYEGKPADLISIRDITERKRAEVKVQNQLDELKRWQTVMLGREDRVQELKREVNELCLRMGEAVRYASQKDAPADPGAGFKEHK